MKNIERRAQHIEYSLRGLKGGTEVGPVATGGNILVSGSVQTKDQPILFREKILCTAAKVKEMTGTARQAVAPYAIEQMDRTFLPQHHGIDAGWGRPDRP